MVLPHQALDTDLPRAHDALRAALANAPHGDYLITTKVKRTEWEAAHEQITQWELDRYLQPF